MVLKTSCYSFIDLKRTDAWVKLSAKEWSKTSIGHARMNLHNASTHQASLEWIALPINYRASTALCISLMKLSAKNLLRFKTFYIKTTPYARVTKWSTWHAASRITSSWKAGSARSRYWQCLLTPYTTICSVMDLPGQQNMVYRRVMIYMSILHTYICYKPARRSDMEYTEDDHKARCEYLCRFRHIFCTAERWSPFRNKVRIVLGWHVCGPQVYHELESSGRC